MPLSWHNELFQLMNERKWSEANDILKKDDIDINAVDENGMTVLMHLVKQNTRDFHAFATKFIRTHAYATLSAPRKRLDMNATNKNGEDVFSLASAYNNVSVMDALNIEAQRQKRLGKNQPVVGYHTTNTEAYTKIEKDIKDGKYPMIGGPGGYFGGGIYFALTQDESTYKALYKGVGFECSLRMGEVLKVSNQNEMNHFITVFCGKNDPFQMPTDVMAQRLLTVGDKPYDSVWGHYDETLDVNARILKTGDEYVVYSADQVKIMKSFSQIFNSYSHVLLFGRQSVWIPQSGGRKRYEQCTVKELQERCAKRTISYRGKRKDELIAALRKK